MTVLHKRGDIFRSAATYVVIPTNTTGPMGAGLAKMARDRWPGIEDRYKAWCRKRPRAGGDFMVMHGLPVICLATKEHWRNPSELAWVERGLLGLRHWLEADCEHDVTVALPMLGCGLGGLQAADVVRLVEDTFGQAGSPTVELWGEGERAGRRGNG